MISGPRRKFCEGIVAGLSATDAYVAAYPKAKREEAAKNTTRLTKDDEVQAEIARLRAKADAKAGSAVLTHAERRGALAGIVRATRGITENGIEVRGSDVIAAAKLDAVWAGEKSGDEVCIVVKIGGHGDAG